MAGITIRPIIEADKPQWEKLYHGYADHYQVTLTETGLNCTWGWLMDRGHPLQGLVAEGEGGRLVALAHFRAMPSPLRGMDVSFLDDLFVDPSARGQRVGGQMLKQLQGIAGRNGWPVMRWITRDDNYRARTLYDRHAVKADWNTYEMTPDFKMTPDFENTKD